MPERRREAESAERRALVADLVRTQATLQARSEQLQGILSSRWYRLARFTWRLRRGLLLRGGAPPRMAGEGSFSRPLNGDAAAAAEPEVWLAAGPPEAAAADSMSAPESQRTRICGLDEPDPRDDAPRGRPARLLLAGHSLSFCAPIARRARQAGASVREDRWRTHGTHEEAASSAALSWADVVHCEWCLGNAAWYSRNKLAGQRLLVRFHRMELDTHYPREVDLEQVDAMVFVARHVLESACERFGWDPNDPRLRVIPNGVETGELRRPKPAGAQFVLSLVGYVPRLKRLDRALDVLERLRARDERYHLIVKGREPWEHGWMARRDQERDFYEALRARLEGPARLRESVFFEPFGDDLPDFLRRAGWILSTSEVEGHSVAVAEGMASGAVPVVLDRRGAGEQYEPRWVHADPDTAAAAVLATQAGGEWQAEAEAARRFAERWDWERLGPIWSSLLLDEPVRPRAA